MLKGSRQRGTSSWSSLVDEVGESKKPARVIPIYQLNRADIMVGCERLLKALGKDGGRGQGADENGRRVAALAQKGDASPSDPNTRKQLRQGLIVDPAVS